MWEVNLNLFERSQLGNRAELGAHKAAMALFNKPETPKAQLRVAQNYKAPGAREVPQRVHPNVFKTPQKSRPTIPIPKAPKKQTGAERRSRRRKSRRQTRRLRK